MATFRFRSNSDAFTPAFRYHEHAQYADSSDLV